MHHEIQLILILLSKLQMEAFEDFECYYDRLPREEVKEAGENYKKLEEILKVFKEKFPEDYEVLEVDVY